MLVFNLALVFFSTWFKVKQQWTYPNSAFDKSLFEVRKLNYNVGFQFGLGNLLGLYGEVIYLGVFHKLRWQDFDFFWPPTPSVDIFYLMNVDKKRTFLDHLPTYTVNIYRYKAIGANATSSVISTTWKCISPCLEIL